VNKLIRAYITVLIVILFTSTTYASQTPKWLYNAINVANPKQLAYFAEIDSVCPHSQDEINNLIDFELSKKRILPLKENIFIKGRVYLNVKISCLTLGDANLVYSIRSGFGRIKPKPAIIYDYDFGVMGVGTRNDLEQSLKDATKRAVAAFISSNYG